MGSLPPPLDIDKNTRHQAFVAIFVSVACCLGSISCGIAFYLAGDPTGRVAGDRNARYPLPKGFPSVALSFVVNLLVTQCLESLAYVHSISLRWALIQEQRLTFNTNVRLFTSSKLSMPNTWYANGLSAACLIISYASTSLLFLPYLDDQTHDGDKEPDRRPRLNCFALWTLGAALLVQAGLSIWCFYSNLSSIPTWDAGSIGTTATVLRELEKTVQHRPNRCMVSVPSPSSLEPSPARPQSRQKSQWQVIPPVRKVVIFIWALALAAFLWFLSMLAASTIKAKKVTLSWNGASNEDTSYGAPYNVRELDVCYEAKTGFEMPFSKQLLLGTLFVCGVQGLQTVGLHCAELVVNISRDEDTWRQLNATTKTRFHFTQRLLATPPFMVAATNWKYVLLFVFKAALHWLLGECLHPFWDWCGPDVGLHFMMIYGRIFVYAILAIAFAIFITYLANEKPKGPQPVTWGHIQTLADLIDDWTLDEHGVFYWGDKGELPGSMIRHAGTASYRKELRAIEMNALYAGNGKVENTYNNRIDR
jgi:hypothetical protein